MELEKSVEMEGVGLRKAEEKMDVGMVVRKNDFKVWISYFYALVFLFTINLRFSGRTLPRNPLQPPLILNSDL